MTKAAAEAKGVAAETKEAEKLAASSAKSPKPKDEVALKKGDTGNCAGGHAWLFGCFRSTRLPALEIFHLVSWTYVESRSPKLAQCVHCILVPGSVALLCLQLF